MGEGHYFTQNNHTLRLLKITACRVVSKGLPEEMTLKKAPKEGIRQLWKETKEHFRQRKSMCQRHKSGETLACSGNRWGAEQREDTEMWPEEVPAGGRADPTELPRPRHRLASCWERGEPECPSPGCRSCPALTWGLGPP